MSPKERAKVVAQLQWLADMLDSRFAVPGTGGRARFGMDPVIGLIPGIGDVLMFAMSLYIVLQAWRIGTPGGVLIKMIGWVIVDVIVGAVPLAGDIADAFLKVNNRNLRLIGITPIRRV